MPVISVDLAYKDYDDVGVAVLDTSASGIDCEFVRVALNGEPRAPDLAAYLRTLADTRRADYLILDGPQGWKHPDNGLRHARLCEWSLNTQGKTGLPGHAKPESWLGFIRFSVDLFEELTSDGWGLYAGSAAVGGAHRVAVESYPYAAWRGLGLPPLPSKAKATQTDIAARAQALRDFYTVSMSKDPTHDELQALAAGLAAIALERGTSGVSAIGGPPVRLHGSWREGFIVSPARAPGVPALSLTQPEPALRGRPRRLSRVTPRAGRTTAPGYVSPNDQEVIRATDLPGTDHGSRTYVLRCRRPGCGLEYGANGTDIWQRKCPRCQGGKPGNAL